MTSVTLQKERYENWRRLHEADGNLTYCLAVFGDHLAKTHAIPEVDGLEAVRYYLMQKHHWLPRDVLSMSPAEMRFALTKEMHNWTLPPEAR